MHVWRRLKELGALPVHQGVSMLPATSQTRKSIARLLERVARDGGEGRCMRIQLVDESEHETAVERSRAARDEEYAEVLERLPELFAELEAETARGRMTFAELEESEADMERFRRWVTRIETRDYFDGHQRAAVAAEMERAARALAEFEAAALDADTAAGEPGPADSPARLREVE
ncbi:hypothetical protein GCM10027563_07640 [Parasphingorhabdus pacifica]